LRDHVIIEVKDREIFADFILEYSEAQKEKVIFEMNEEFSILINRTQ